jgi:DNA-binding transcriptional regulator of glucitol operon
MALNMTRAQLVDTKHKLLISDELRITEPDNYDKRVIEFNKLVDKVRKYHKDKSTNSLKTQPAIIEPTQQLSRRAMKAIAKQQANTITINSDTNLVSLIKK